MIEKPNPVSQAEIEWLEKAVALEIRKNIDLKVLSQAHRLKSSLETLYESRALSKGRSRPEMHFSGSSLTKQLGPADWLEAVKAESDVPSFLKLENHWSAA